MVIDRVTSARGSATSPSPGRGRVVSCSVLPQRAIHRRARADPITAVARPTVRATPVNLRQIGLPTTDPPEITYGSGVSRCRPRPPAAPNPAAFVLVPLRWDRGVREINRGWPNSSRWRKPVPALAWAASSTEAPRSQEPWPSPWRRPRLRSTSAVVRYSLNRHTRFQRTHMDQFGKRPRHHDAGHE